VAEIFRRALTKEIFAVALRLRLLVLVVKRRCDRMMRVVNLLHEIRDGELQLMHVKAPGIGLGRELMAAAKIKKNISTLRDHQLAGFQERWRKWNGGHA